LYRALAEATGCVLAKLDESRAMLPGQGDWEKFTGQSSAESLKWGYLDAVQAKDRATLSAKWSACELATRPLEVVVRVWSAEARSYRRCSLRALPLVVPERGKLHAWLLLLRDLEREQRRDGIPARPNEYDETRMDALRTVSRGVAHQINNLMHGVLMQAEIIRRHVDTSSPAAKCAQQLMRSTDIGADFARRLLEFASVQTQQPSAQLCAVLASMHAPLRSLCGPNTQFRLSLDPEIGSVLADEASLRRVVTNLVQNAKDALGDRHGHISVKTDRRHLQSHELAGACPAILTPHPAYICVEVADDGPGFSKAESPRIFEPFHANEQTGRGLGLPAVLGMVRQWGGSVQVASELGAGTRVRVLLPCKHAATS